MPLLGGQIENYRQRISGPLLDRIDLHVEVPLVEFKEPSRNDPHAEDSATIRERVSHARCIHQRRLKGTRTLTHADFA